MANSCPARCRTKSAASRRYNRGEEVNDGLTPARAGEAHAVVRPRYGQAYFGASPVGARLKCHRVCKVEMTLGRRGGLTRPHVSPEFCAMDGPLSAYLAPPDCLAAAGVVDRPADGSADMKLAARARMPAPRRAAYSRRSRRAT